MRSNGSGISFLFQVHHIRLRGGQHASEGRVEIFLDGKWGTICHEHWDINDANVVCKQLGFGTAEKAIRWAEYGQGTVPVCHLDSFLLSFLVIQINNKSNLISISFILTKYFESDLLRS